MSQGYLIEADKHDPIYTEAELQAAIAEEREACAEVVETMVDSHQLGTKIAAAIRARGQRE